MKEMSPGTALRQLQQAQAGLKKARQLLKQVRAEGQARPAVLRVGWESLAQANRLMAEIPLAAADEVVMTRQLAVQRYATALLVRLRRLLRNEGIDPEEFAGEDDRFADEDFED
jgi:erythromycin esterase-like protein